MKITMLLLLSLMMTVADCARAAVDSSQRPVFPFAINFWQNGSRLPEAPRQIKERIAEAIAAEGLEPVFIKELKTPMDGGPFDGSCCQEIMESGEKLLPVQDLLNMRISAKVENSQEGVSVSLNFYILHLMPLSEDFSWWGPDLGGLKTAGMIRCAKDQEVSECLGSAFETLRPQFQTDISNMHRWVSGVKRAKSLTREIESNPSMGALKRVDLKGLLEELNEVHAYIKRRM